LNLIRRLLKETVGYSLAELLLVITIFAIGIVPLYKMVISTGKVQKSAEETYEATLQAQSLLQAVRKQVDEDVKNEYEFSRGVTPLNAKDWMNPSISHPVYSILDFLGVMDPASITAFNEKYNTDNLLYEVHIWHMLDGNSTDPPISLTAYIDPSLVPDFSVVDPSSFIKVEIQDAIKEHFLQKESLMWTALGGITPKAIGEITYQGIDTIKIRGNGIEGNNITIDSINTYTNLNKSIELTYKSGSEIDSNTSEMLITHQFIIDEKVALNNADIIQLSIDLTTFPSDAKTKIIRVENKTKATVVLPVYNEKNPANIEIYPIQHENTGNIIVESRNKLEPSKNFIIGIIVKDAYNSTFGDENKILSKIVDVYSYDYNKQ